MPSLNSLRSKLFLILFNSLVSLSCFSAFQMPAEAATLNVPSTQYPTIQSAINAANRGDTIVVEAGRTYTENLVLKYKSGTGYVTIQSSALASLPTAGNRVAPADASNMPTIRSTAAGGTTVISTESGANPTAFYRLIGLNILRHNSTSQQSTLIDLGTEGTSQNTLAEVPNNIIIDRCLIRGADNAYTRRAINVSAKDVQIINSYIGNFYENGADSQAILIWNTPGDILIANNFLEAGSENILVGGVDVSIPSVVPTNITIEHNHIYKPLSWRGNVPNKNVKNHIELKYGKNVRIRNNIIENNWAEGQNGNSINFTPINQGGTMPQAEIADVEFEFNIIKNVGIAFQFTIAYDNTARPLDNISLSNNLVLTKSGFASLTWPIVISHGYDPSSGGPILFTHNTFYGPGDRFSFESGPSGYINQWIFTHNILSPITGSFGDLQGQAGQGLQVLNDVPSSWTWQGNVHRRSQGTGPGRMPENNFYPGSVGLIAFADSANLNLELSSTSPYKGIAPGGKDPGVNWDELMSRTSCVASGRRSDCSAASPTEHDFDGDGKADISVFRPETGVWYLNRSSDGFVGVGFGNSTDIVTPGDFDGDGKSDIAVFRPSTGIWYLLNSTNWSATIVRFGLNGDLPVVADYDGDGRADISVWRPSNGVWYRLNSTDGQFHASQFGMLGDRPAIGDYDGDARADFAVFRPSTGVWYLSQSTGGVNVVQFGIGTDRTAQADYTGDGRTDIAVWRPSNGMWYRLDQGTGQMSAIHFGSPGDIPAPADYDGDGQADPTVFRPSSGIWYILRSSAGFSAMQFGMSGDLPTASDLNQ